MILFFLHSLSVISSIAFMAAEETSHIGTLACGNCSLSCIKLFLKFVDFG